MRYLSLFTTALRWLVLSSFLSAGFAMAQQEPSMAQIYSTAQAGKLDEAQVMLQQVLVAHPKSAKAHFVQAELYSRQGNLPKAREALSQAQSLAPGLPFAKAEAVQALEKQLAARSVAVPATASAAYSSAQAPAKPSSSWLLPVLLALGVVAGGYFLFRRKPAQSFDQGPGYATGQGIGNGLNGPQSFGPGGMQPHLQGGYGQQPGYGQPGNSQAASSGMGGRIMGGVATGLAVGAGVMAAEAIGRNLMGNHNKGNAAVDNSGNYEPPAANTDMGGENFGVADTSWDDAGSSDVGGGGDWDN